MNSSVHDLTAQMETPALEMRAVSRKHSHTCKTPQFCFTVRPCKLNRECTPLLSQRWGSKQSFGGSGGSGGEFSRGEGCTLSQDKLLAGISIPKWL
eukprot:1477894-Rhodomonas_salina.1